MKSRVIKLMLVPLMFALFLNVSYEVVEGISAASAVLMEQKTGRVLFEKDAYTKRKIASITKIMTAIIAVESGELDEVVEVTQEMVQVEGSSIYLEVGEKIKLEELVYGLMLRSGNDAAQAIAICVGGSIAEFVHMMNEKAQWIGMNNTKFTNPHGLDDGDIHGSSAYDMALLTRYAMENEEFAKISGTKKFTTKTSDLNWQRVWTNKNKMLTQYYEYSTGGKTGFTKKAGRSLVSTASNKGLDLIVVTINAPGDWNDHMSLFDNAFASYKIETFETAGQIENLDDKFYGKQLYLFEDIVYPVTEDEKEHFTVEYVLQKPKKNFKVKKGEQKIVGKAELYFDSNVVLEKPVYYFSSEKKETKKAQNNFDNSIIQVFAQFLGVKTDG